MNRLLPKTNGELVIVGAGVGRFLIEQIASESGIPYRDFASQIVPESFACDSVAGDCAPAVSLALM